MPFILSSLHSPRYIMPLPNMHSPVPCLRSCLNTPLYRSLVSWYSYTPCPCLFPLDTPPSYLSGLISETSNMASSTKVSQCLGTLLCSHSGMSNPSNLYKMIVTFYSLGFLVRAFLQSVYIAFCFIHAKCLQCVILFLFHRPLCITALLPVSISAF